MTSETNYLTFIRFLATLLITNSHLDSLYPIPQLGTGGAIGNALFFLIAGYGLALSEQKKQNVFIIYYYKRIVRIYPTLVVVLIFQFVIQKLWEKWTWQDYITNFIWPTPYPFIAAIMICYLFFFIPLKIDTSIFYIFSIFICFITYCYCYFYLIDISYYSIEGSNIIKWFFYCQMMFFGGLLTKIKDRIKSGGFLECIALFILFIFYYSFLLMVNHGFLAEYQLIIHLITYPIVYLMLSLSKSKFILEKIMGCNFYYIIISFVANLSLEIYLIQYVIYSNSYIKSFIFPFNIMVFFLILLILSKCCAIFSDSIGTCIGRLSAYKMKGGNFK